MEFMAETERILKQESGVKAYEGEHPPSVGLKAGAFADVGTLILTDQRLVYVNKGGAARAASWVLGGALVAWAAEKTVSRAQIDEVVKYKGSYSIPLREITGVETARHIGSAYLRVDNQSPGIKPSHSFIFGSGFSKDADWVSAINSAIATARKPPMSPPPMSAPQMNSVTNNFPPQTPNPANPIPPPPSSGNPSTQQPRAAQPQCPSCGAAANENAKFCVSCGSSLSPPKAVAPPSKFCGQCGSQLSTGVRFCEACGAKVTG
jgi:hypothetical protein